MEKLQHYYTEHYSILLKFLFFYKIFKCAWDFFIYFLSIYQQHLWLARSEFHTISLSSSHGCLMGLRSGLSTCLTSNPSSYALYEPCLVLALGHSHTEIEKGSYEVVPTEKKNSSVLKKKVFCCLVYVHSISDMWFHCIQFKQLMFLQKLFKKITSN